MMPDLADPDSHFGRPSSPFALEQLLHQRRADLIERVAITRLEAVLARAEKVAVAEREGALLTSAILFGALIDRRRWGEWLIASRGMFVGIDFRPQQTGTITVTAGNETVAVRTIPRLHHHGRVWIDLPMTAGRDAKRWVADPLTHCLLRHWQDARVRMPPPTLSPAEAVGAFLGWRGLDPGPADQLLDGLYRAAVLKWRMRMPGFLVEEIGVDGRCVSLPDERWRVMLSGTVRIVPAHRTPWEPAPRKTAGNDPVMAILIAALPEGRHSGGRSFVEAARTLAQAAQPDSLSPVERGVLLWAADRIDPRRDRRQRQRGLAPSTIRGRAKRLLHLLRGAFGQSDPLTLDAAGFAGRLNDHLSEVRLWQKDHAHLACYTDWQQRRTGSLSVEWHGGERRAGGVRNTIVTGAEYSALLDRFDRDTANGAMARLLVILGFRAGLRWQEAIGLRTHDLLVTGRHVELSIRQNADRWLKTPAGRRVVPLHALLSASERQELLDWWHDRRIVAMAQTGPNTADTLRLFPCWGLPLQGALRRDIAHALTEVTGGSVGNFHQLRHACGSYLLATLALPGDLADRELVPPIDPTLVSQARRRRIAPALMGEGAGTRGAVHAVGALLGHSGDQATLRSYMHLHDWLAGLHVARPESQPALPASLAARLLGMRVPAVERANRRAAAAGMPVDHVRRRGRPRTDDHRKGAVILGRLLDRPGPPGSGGHEPTRRQRPIAGHAPEWQMLAALLGVADDAERHTVLDHPQLHSPDGRRIAAALLALIEERTRGRRGVTRRRFVDAPGEGRQRRTHRLGDAEAERLGRLYRGVLALAPAKRRLLCSAFVKGYDRPRGVLRVPDTQFGAVIEALRLADCRDHEMTVVHSQRSATIRIGDDGRTDRGFLWAMLFATAVQRSGSRIGRRQLC